MTTKWVLACATVIAVACGPTALKEPFSGLQAGVCNDDSECDIGLCPNACNKGQSVCGYPQVFSRTDILRKCPCAQTPSKTGCEAPDVSACGPQVDCAPPQDRGNVRSKCIQGMCAARFTDGGTVP